LFEYALVLVLVSIAVFAVPGQLGEDASTISSPQLTVLSGLVLTEAKSTQDGGKGGGGCW